MFSSLVKDVIIFVNSFTKFVGDGTFGTNDAKVGAEFCILFALKLSNPNLIIYIYFIYKLNLKKLNYISRIYSYTSNINYFIWFTMLKCYRCTICINGNNIIILN